ncbi:hypothetical protein MMC19_002301 [Ptychographa xylographoides]|nr:hypothetical protein [Ptychographa xylographoides]
MILQSASYQVSVIVTQRDAIKTAKNALERANRLDKSVKIAQFHSEAYITQAGFVGKEKESVVLTTSHRVDGADLNTLPDFLAACSDAIAADLGLVDSSISPYIVFAIRKPAHRAEADLTICLAGLKDPFARAIKDWLSTIPEDVLLTTDITSQNVFDLAQKSYTIYPPLLLFPANTFAIQPWSTLFSTSLAEYLPSLYNHICDALHVTHIAINAPIPLTIPPSSPAPTPLSTPNPNTLRNPTHIQPLCGSFDLPSPLWVSTTQHSLIQTWAPLHTMFSRGNIIEKARILTLPALTLSHLHAKPDKTTAVDLYAGIGYFAFYYAKAGVGRVLGWELSGWSVEGFVKGACANGRKFKKENWAVKVVKAGEEIDADEQGWGNERFLLFHEDNQSAAARIAGIRSQIPPVRHVNCGFLPTSAPSWSVAVQVLDPALGGWVHAHENIAVVNIESRRAEIVDVFDALVNRETNTGTDTDTARSPASSRTVQCQHVERVKSYAPGVMHCVLDIYIGPVLP